MLHRSTRVTPNNHWTLSNTFQNQLAVFWVMIENHYEEDWRIDANGDLILEVDSDMLERVLSDNYAQAWVSFGTVAGGQTEDGERFLLHRPETLQGTYTIKGVYDASQRLVNGERTYFFTQGA